MDRTIALGLIALAGWVSYSAGATRLVPADYATIQAAIDDCNSADVVIVAPGRYTGDGNRDIDFNGKAITVKSENGAQNCIIDCGGRRPEWEWHRGLDFHSGEGPDSIVDGFTITNGCVVGCGAYPGGGGILCLNSSPTIRNCVISGNRSAGICAAPGSVGGGIAMWNGSPTLINCIITGNSVEPGRIEGGGGIGCFEGGCIAVNCIISGNRGCGIHFRRSNASLRGCTFAGNSVEAFYCAWDSTVTAWNCILWGNDIRLGSLIYGDEAHPATLTIGYCDVEGGRSGVRFDRGSGALLVWGPGNIDADPCFAATGYRDSNDMWVDGDYHLKSQGGRWDQSSRSWAHDDVTSPCIDAGDPAGPIGEEPFPNGGVANMGAYGGTAEASKSYFGGPVCDVIVAGDVNGDCKVDFPDFVMLAGHWLDDYGGQAPLAGHSARR